MQRPIILPGYVEGLTYDLAHVHLLFIAMIAVLYGRELILSTMSSMLIIIIGVGNGAARP
jgi:hypothetical protein